MGPVFSPDGKYVAYHFQRSPEIISPGGLTLVVRSLLTGEEREIHTRLIQFGPVRWFPDGESVLVPVLRSKKDRLIDYYRIDLGSAKTELIRQSEPKKFTSDHPDLTTNGKSIFFTEMDIDNPEKALIRFKKFDLESRQETLLHQLPRGKTAMNIQLSPDEKMIAWIERSQEPPSSALNSRPVEGGTTREILRLEQPEHFSAYGFVWAPNGQSLLVSKFTGAGDGQESELLQVPVDGGEPSKLGISMNRIYFGDIHKDGRRVAFYSGEQKGRAREIWALEGFLSE